MREDRAWVLKIYQNLYSRYGPQGWWPLTGFRGKNPTKTGSINGYHPLNYDLPETEEQIFEVMIGAVLTQNTAWTSAEQALLNLKQINALKPQSLLKTPPEIIKEAIRCAGFLNQKSLYLREIARFYVSLHGRIPKRDQILMVKGVGNETADSILLYAYKQPEFVIDAYTRRILGHLGLVDEKISYMDLKNIFQSNLPEDIPIYQEYHALLVEHAKRYYGRKPYGVGDPLKELNIFIDHE